jgi:CRISPR-associated protein Cas2
MRNVFLICYDVADAKRLRRTYKKMCGYGTPVQYANESTQKLVAFLR